MARSIHDLPRAIGLATCGAIGGLALPADSDGLAEFSAGLAFGSRARA